MEDYKIGDLCNFIAKSCEKSPKKIKTQDENNKRKKKKQKTTFDSLNNTSSINNDGEANNTKTVIANYESKSSKIQENKMNEANHVAKSKKNRQSSSCSDESQLLNGKTKKMKKKAKRKKQEASNNVISPESDSSQKINAKENASDDHKKVDSKKSKKNRRKNKQMKTNVLENSNSNGFLGNKRKHEELPDQDSGKSVETSQINGNEAKKPKLTREEYLLKNSKKKEKIQERKDNSLPTRHPDAEKRTIFVGNVSASTKRNVISAFFGKFGAVETVRIRGIGVENINTSKKEAITQKKIHHNRKTVIAFVRFKDINSVEKALSANGQVFNGLHISVDTAEGGAKKDKDSIFIGNLPFDLQDEELWNKFSDCGQITNVRVVHSATTGGGKGIAFVTFESNDGVELALQKHGEKLRGRDMNIQRTSKKAKTRQSSGRLSFMKHDKPKVLQDKTQKREHNFQRRQLHKNFSGVKVSYGKSKNHQKHHLSKDAKKKKNIAEVLTQRT